MPASTSNSEPASAPRTLKCVVEYDGTDLCGWQRQDNGPTVQEHLEDAIRSMTHEETTILGASRTDAGVHARGQVFVFQTERDIPAFGFRRGINSVLPDAIALRSVEDVDASFHPRFDALGKHYRYSLLNCPSPSPLLRRQTWHRPMQLDLPHMQEVATALVGEHDFSAFRASGCGAHTPHRRIDRIELSQDGDCVHIDVWGNAFLRNMVRIIAGSLVDAGMGKFGREDMAEVLASRDRRRAGQTAPPQGLCLIEVFYPDAGS